MNSLLGIIVKLLYLNNIIVSHASQYHKSKEISYITFALLPHKIYIYNDLSITYWTHEKMNHLQIT